MKKHVCIAIISVISLLVFNLLSLDDVSAASKTAKAVIDGNGTMTFYYDSDNHESDGAIVYDIDQAGYAAFEDVPWYSNRNSVIKVAFDSSFSGFRPTSTSSYFFYFSKCTEISGLQYLDTSLVTDMSSMFSGCSALSDIDISSFDTSNVKNMAFMFEYCIKMGEINVSSFNTRNVTDMHYMFRGCLGIKELDLRSFDTSRVKNMSGMFRETSLQRIIVGDNWSTVNVTNSDYMFSESSHIIGGKGTVIDSNYIDKTYARVDSGESSPGYLTSASDYVEHIELIHEFDKMDYAKDYESLDTTGGLLKVSYLDGRVETVNIDENMVSGFDNSTVGKCNITIEYKSSMVSADVNIVNISDSGEWGNNLSWFIDTNNRLVIYGSGEMKTIETGEEYPWKHSKDTIKAVEIKEGVTSIAGEDTTGAFSGMTNVSNAVLPKSMITIGASAFDHCNLSEVFIPEGVVTIGEYAFCHNDNNANIVISEGVRTIGYAAFSGVAESIELPSSLQNMDDGALKNSLLPRLKNLSIAAGNDSFSVKDGVLYNNDQKELVLFPCGLENEAFSVPSSVAVVGEYAFYGCNNLKTITFNSDAPDIGLQAFGGDELDVFYPCDNKTWTDGKCADYGAQAVSWKIGHKYGTLISEKSSTCTEAGLAAHYLCSGCGKLFDADKNEKTEDELFIDIMGHKYGEIIAEKPATCTEDGMRAHYECTTCSTFFDVEKNEKTEEELAIGRTGHEYGEIIAEKPATCTKDGMSAHYMCSKCGELFDSDKNTKTEKELTIQTTGHVYGKIIKEVPATCTEDGMAAYYRCLVCDNLFDKNKSVKTFDELIITKKGHSYGSLIAEKLATCTEDGMMAHYKCTACSKLFDADKTEKTEEELAIGRTGHEYGEIIAEKPATCTEDGMRAYYECSKCKELFDDNKNVSTAAELKINRKGHRGGTATCQSKAECAVCNEEYGELAEHEYGNLILEKTATCTEDGMNQHYECGVCGKLFDVDKIVKTASQLSISKKGHIGGTATCQAKAECEVCHEHYGELAEHEYGKLVTEKKATCTQDGMVAHYECSVCGILFDKDRMEKTETELTLQKLGHSMTRVKPKVPTCLEIGNNEYYICGRCNGIFKDEVGDNVTTVEAELLDKGTHQWTDWTTIYRSTCKQRGLRIRFCNVCDKEERETMDKLDHEYVHESTAPGNLKNGSEYDRCPVCGIVRNYITVPGYSTCYVKSFGLKAGSKCFTAKWKKQSASVQKKFGGYQIIYSVNEDMSAAKKVSAKKTSASKTISSLKKGTKYYVQARTYTKSGGTTFYSAWTTKKTVTAK